MYPRIKELLNYLEYAVLRIIYTTCRLIPFEICMKLADMISPVLSFCFPFRKAIILQNLKKAFPNESEQFLKRILRKTYRNFFLMLIEFIHFGKTENLYRQIIKIEGKEHIKEAGVGEQASLIVTGHLGNWELMGVYFASQGIRFSVLSKPIHNPKIHEFVKSLRDKVGIQLISTRKSPMKQIFKTIQEKSSVVFMVDQDARRSGVFIDFFGIPASTFPAPAVLSLRTGLPLLPVFDVRTNLITHKVIIYPPIYPQEGDREKVVENMMKEYTRILEEMIRKYPDQYFWFHRRWKTKPKRKANL